MKNFVLILLLFGFIATGHSQILLKETKVVYRPFSMQVNPLNHSANLEIPESVFGEFQKDPLAFIRTHFDINTFIKDNEEHDFDAYEVNFRTTNGRMLARYNKNGDLVSTVQKFKNVPLPELAHLQIMKKFAGSIVIGNTYIAHSKAWNITSEVYKVKIKDGEKTRRLRIDKNSEGIVLAEL